MIVHEAEGNLVDYPLVTGRTRTSISKTVRGVRRLFLFSMRRLRILTLALLPVACDAYSAVAANSFGEISAAHVPHLRRRSSCFRNNAGAEREAVIALIEPIDIQILQQRLQGTTWHGILE